MNFAWSKIKRKDSTRMSIRSSTASSTSSESSSGSGESGCRSPSPSDPTARPASDHIHRHRHPHPHASACDFEFGPMGTIKRKPSINPKLPLTSTTKLIAKLSAGADSRVDFPCRETRLPGQQYGTLKLMRRSNTEERMSITSATSLESAFRSSHTASESSSIASHPMEEIEDDDADDLVDELPLPPPPLISSLTSSVSTLSLSLPPPPPEFASAPETGQASPASSNSSSRSSEDRSSCSSSCPNDTNDDEDTLTRPSSRRRQSHYPGQFNPHQPRHDYNAGRNCGAPVVVHPANQMMDPVSNTNSSSIPDQLESGCGLHPSACHNNGAISSFHQIPDMKSHPQQEQGSRQHRNLHRHRNNSRHCQHVTSSGSQPEGCCLISSSPRISSQLDPSRKFKPLYSSSSSCSSCETDPAAFPHSHEDLFVANVERDATPILLNSSSGQQGCLMRQSQGAAHSGLVRRATCSQRPAERIYDSVHTYRKHVDGAGIGSDPAHATPAVNGLHPNQSANEAIESANPSDRLINTATYVKGVYASFHHPPREELRHPMKGPLAASPEEFLRSIQAVMERKWKVAQSLAMMPQTLSEGTCFPALQPNVMGFRETAIVDPIPEGDTSPLPPPPPPLVENYPPSPGSHPVAAFEIHANPMKAYFRPADQPNVPTPFKRTKSLLPPAPPRRSESTKLSSSRA